MGDGTDWVPWYIDLLKENARLRQGFHDALDLIEDLLADPFIVYSTRTWGPIGPPRRLSEWNDTWDDLAAPLIHAIAGDAKALPKPWAKIERDIQAQRLKQAIPVFHEPPKGGVDL